MRATRLLAAAILLVGTPAAWADEATDAFDQLYGDDLKRVLATPWAADDIALARQFLEAAKKVASQPALLAVLCDNAYELAIKDSSGYAAAKSAMEFLADKVPDKKIDCLQKCAAIPEKQYAAARGDARTKAGEALLQALSRLAEAQADAQDSDAASATLRQAITVATAIKSDSKSALQTQLDNLAPQQKAERQIAALKAKLEATPDDSATRRELVRLYLVELDNPAGAAAFVDESLDDATRKYLPAAANPVEEAPEVACRELGGWYRSLADQAQAVSSKETMLRRAKAYYERFMHLHNTDDLARATATLMLTRIQDALAKLPAPKKPAPASGWIDCLKLVDPAKHTVSGKWRMKDGVLYVAAEKACRIAIPLPVQARYQLQADFVRRTGTDAVSFFLTVGGTMCNFTLSAYDGQANGLEMIEGKYATAGPGGLTNGQRYTIDISVLSRQDTAEIAAVLDGRPLLRWKGPVSAISPNKVWPMPDPRYLGLGAWLTDVEFHRVQLRMLPDDATPPAETPDSTKTSPNG